MLRNMDINLSKDALSTSSNHISSTTSVWVDPKDEDIVHNIMEDIGLEIQNSIPTNHR
jgi:hypothetical protein